MRVPLILFFTFFSIIAEAQQITGVWKGRSKSTKIELKLIKKGDSLLGTSYYYLSKNNYRRYSVKGYFDDETNSVVWWDDILLDDKSSRGVLGPSKQEGMLAVANFNCPGDGVMKLDGKSSLRDDKNGDQGPLNLLKATTADFSDEWDFVIENYTLGANDPFIIDSIASLANSGEPPAKNNENGSSIVIDSQPIQSVKTPTDREILPSPTNNNHIPVQPVPATQTIEDAFLSRTKVLEQVIPIAGDSIELNFYDNAEIDGDSIALFLNGKKIFQHVMITDKAYTVRFAVRDLQDDNEAVMVAENLGSIPPNTALMIANVGDKRYEAHLYATLNSSALIRFVKAAEGKAKTAPPVQ
jgi:hypothetical protein